MPVVKKWWDEEWKHKIKSWKEKCETDDNKQLREELDDIERADQISRFIETLLPSNAWVTNFDMEDFVTVLNKCNEIEDTIFVTTRWYSTHDADDREDAIFDLVKNVQEIKARKKTAIPREWVIPCLKTLNGKGFHWFMVKIDTKACTITPYCSTKATDEKRLRTLGQDLIQTVRKMSGEEEVNSVPVPVTVNEQPERYSLQKDDFSCGIYVMMAMLCMFDGKNPEDCNLFGNEHEPSLGKLGNYRKAVACCIEKENLSAFGMTVSDRYSLQKRSKASVTFEIRNSEDKMQKLALSAADFCCGQNDTIELLMNLKDAVTVEGNHKCNVFSVKTAKKEMKFEWNENEHKYKQHEDTTQEHDEEKNQNKRKATEANPITPENPPDLKRFKWGSLSGSGLFSSMLSPVVPHSG